MEALDLVEYQQNSDYEVNNQNENVEYFVPNDEGNQESRRKHHHTPNQVQIMEVFFKDCPRPNENQRKYLSQNLGLNPLQVKTWFQNKRSQLKTKQKQSENSLLKDHNEKLQAENKKLKEIMTKITCLQCGEPTSLKGISSSPLDQLKYENATLKNELESLHNLTKSRMETFARNNPQFSSPLVTPMSIPLGVTSSSYGGQQLIMNSEEQINFASNMQFYVPYFVPPYDGQITFQQTMGIHFGPQQLPMNTSRQRGQDAINPFMD